MAKQKETECILTEIAQKQKERYEREWEFEQVCRKYIREYGIRFEGLNTVRHTNDCCRIGKLLADSIITIIKQPNIWNDAYSEFMTFAYYLELRCDPLQDEFDKKGNFRPTFRYPKYQRIFEGLDFKHYMQIAMDVFLRQRKPLLRRTPIRKAYYDFPSK